MAWAGADIGSGVVDYDVLVSTDGGPFEVWLEHTTDVAATFLGEPGKTYGFASVARDWTFNTEAAPAAADAVVTADPAVGLPGPVGNSLALVKDTGSIRLTWTGISGALDYQIFGDLTKGGVFPIDLGTAASGAQGVVIPSPADSRLFRVAGRSTCGSAGAK